MPVLNNKLIVERVTVWMHSSSMCLNPILRGEGAQKWFSNYPTLKYLVVRSSGTVDRGSGTEQYFSNISSTSFWQALEIERLNLWRKLNSQWCEWVRFIKNDIAYTQNHSDNTTKYIQKFILEILMSILTHSSFNFAHLINFACRSLKRFSVCQC